MNSQNPKSFGRTLLEMAITAGIVLTFVLLTVVVIMLVTGTLNVINKNLLHLSFINIISAFTAVVILIMSAAFLIKTFKSIRTSVMKALFHDNSSE